MDIPKIVYLADESLHWTMCKKGCGWMIRPDDMLVCPHRQMHERDKKWYEAHGYRIEYGHD